MKHKECKIVCDGKEIGTLKCDEEGITIKWSEECKKMHGDCCEHNEGEGCC